MVPLSPLVSVLQMQCKRTAKSTATANVRLIFFAVLSREGLYVKSDES